MSFKNIINVSPPDERNPDITLKPAVIAHQDGSTEKIYLQATPASSKSGDWHLRLSMTYLAIGIVAIAFGIYVTYKQLKNKQNG